MAARFFASSWSRQQLAVASVASGAVGGLVSHAKLTLAEERKPSSNNLKATHLASWQDNDGTGLVGERTVNKYLSPMAVKWPNMNFVNPEELVMGHIVMNDSKAKSRDQRIAGGCVRANACKDIWWDPSMVRAGIVTCGGLCPGLNSIIREVTNCLHHDYGVKHIMGFQFGYNGLANPEKYMPINLTTDSVREIHYEGGSIIKCGRGGFDAETICNNLERMGVNMLFIVGGDGSQGAGHLLFEACRQRGLNISIVGVPKSIDNDVLFFDQTFGFETAVASAAKVIQNACIEAKSCHRGVGIVKLMGRDAGWVALHASWASNKVDLCLIPEVDFDMEEVHKHIEGTLDRKGHAVIAVAEGAGQNLGADQGKDETGHTKYFDIGSHLKSSMDIRLKKSGKGGRCFYIEPTYIIRSGPADPTDHIYCSRLSHNAVHVAMRGYTGVCVGAMHNVIVILPSCMIASGKKTVPVHSSAWQSTVQICHMPRTLAGFAKAKQKLLEANAAS